VCLGLNSKSYKPFFFAKGRTQIGRFLFSNRVNWWGEILVPDPSDDSQAIKSSDMRLEFTDPRLTPDNSNVRAKCDLWIGELAKFISLEQRFFFDGNS